MSILPEPHSGQRGRGFKSRHPDSEVVAKAIRVGGTWKLEVINETGKIKQGDEHALMRFAVSK